MPDTRQPTAGPSEGKGLEGRSDSAEGRMVRLHDIAGRVFNRLPIGVIVFDLHLRAVSQNRAAEHIVAAGEDVVGTLQRAASASGYEDWAASIRKVLQTGQTVRFDGVSFQGAGGRDLLVDVACMALTDELDGEIIGGMLVLQDVTREASMEKRLAVSERLAAVGKLAARVAHELNNPLDGILRYINLAIRVTEENKDDRVVRYLAESRKGLMRMTHIIRELLQFSRTSHSDYQQTTVNQLVEEAIKALADEAAGAGVTVVLSLDGGMPALHAGNLFQVFCNLIKNAIDAMPNGGTLTISTRLADRSVVTRFDDTGAGLPEEADRIFEPFFTTKESGKGTGLGLAVCKDIVERYNGQLHAANRPKGGASFEVRIPLSSCAASDDQGT